MTTPNIPDIGRDVAACKVWGEVLEAHRHHDAVLMVAERSACPLAGRDRRHHSRAAVAGEFESLSQRRVRSDALNAKKRIRVSCCGR